MPLVNPIISKVAPLKVGGSANAGAGLLDNKVEYAVIHYHSPYLKRNPS